ncbi:transcriptional regulator [Flavobacterium sp. HXWNR69]|uniref:Transcriptional regulator n=1 Tax=Flavobacterium fragile TaxID=2949085 RepID=A0ABT0TFG5_9FLAO|nr:transcriptional regulator [Flavobacterium sp. HXWNR69]MCL9769721.1 transcriptional regulator [Flavobacterium sp. HXWNR69]
MTLKKNLTSLYIFFLASTLQAQNKVTFEDTQKAFQEIFTNPQLAKKKLDAYEKITVENKDSIYGLVLNAKGIYYGVLGNNKKSLEHFKKALPFFGLDVERQVKTLNNIAIVYHKMNQIEESINTTQEALNLAKTTKKNNLIALVYGHYATCYSAYGSYKNAVKYLIESIEYWEKAPKEYEIYTAIEKQKLGNLYNKMGNYDFAIDLFNSVLPIMKKKERLDAYYLTLISKSESLLKQKKYNEVLKNIAIAEKGLIKFNNNIYNQYLHDIKGNTYLEMNQWQKAQEEYQKNLEIALANQIPNGVHSFCVFAEKAMEVNSPFLENWLKIAEKKEFQEILKVAPLDVQLHYHKTIAKVAKRKGNITNYFNHFDAVEKLKDSIANRNNFVETIAIQTQYELKLKKQENTILAQKLNIEKSKSIKTILASLLIIAILILFLIWKSFKNKYNKEKLKAAELEKNLIKEQLANATKDSEAEKNRIKQQEREIIELTAITIEKEETVSHILELIEANKNKQAIAELKKRHPNKGYWKKIVEKINTLDADFINHLSQMYPFLTQGDLEFCSLLKMNLSSKEIASILQINVESVFTKKYRLQKKLKLNQHTDLRNWLMELNNKYHENNLNKNQ